MVQLMMHGAFLKVFCYNLRDRFVPLRILGKYGREKPVWMSYKAWKCVKKKNKVYAKYKDSKHPAYVCIAKETERELQKAKVRSEQKLAENIRGNTKSFFACV